MELPKGAPTPKATSYLAKVIDSDLIEIEEYKFLRLKLMMYKKHRKPAVVWKDFQVCHSNQELQRCNRRHIQEIGNAVGLSWFDDSKALHGKVFLLTVTPYRPKMFSCRAASHRQVKAFEQAVERGNWQ